MSEWIEVELGAYVESISDTFKFTDKKVIFLNTSDIYNNSILTSEYSIPSTLPGQAKKRIKNNDLLFSEIRPINKRFTIVNVENPEDYVVSTKLMVLRCKSNISIYFLKYFLTSHETLIYLQSLAEDRSGTFPQITFDHIAKLKIGLPPFQEQKAIASILLSLDDKIDLLYRQNKTLESMAETLFRQCFVEEAQEDWEHVKLSDLGKVICGKTPSKNNSKYYSNDIPFLKIPDMHGKTYVINTIDNLSFEGSNSQKNKLVRAGSICVSCIATVGLVCLTEKDIHTNQQINSITPIDNIHKYFLFLYMKSMHEELHNMASGGTATLNLNTNNFSNIKIPLPANNILKKFNEIATTIFDKIYSNSLQIKSLESLRDTLLPKLMSGELRVQYEESQV